MADMRVSLCGIELDNPVIPASGTFGYGYEFAELYDINVLGTFSFKGTTREPRFGNPTPRIAECTAGLINSVGLQNPGVEKVIEEELPKLAKVFHKKVMANVSGFSVEDYVYSCERLDIKELFVLAVATSIDALAVGITFAFLKTAIVPAISIIGVTTFVLSVIGVAIGHKFGMKFKSKAEIAGGVVLVLIGLKILLEHLEIVSF